MSRDIHNERVKKAGRALPGRDGDYTDTSRGYVGWGPHEDATYTDGKTVEHADWEAALAALQNPAREVHDFYFEVNTPSDSCECCAGSGRNRDFAELDRGFYRSGGGRWAGWGEGRLHQNEIDALVEKGRLGRAKKGEVTPDNLRRHLGRWGHDAINRWVLVPVRAANLGIDVSDCFECVGTGLTPNAPTRISLHMWTFDPMAGTSRVDTAEDVGLGQLAEIREYLSETAWEGVKRRFGWANGDNMHPSIRYEENFSRDPDRPFRQNGWWNSSKRFSSFAAFKSDFGIGGDEDLNLIFDYRIVADESWLADNPFASSELPGEFSLHVMMTHPRKGADRMLVINGCRAEDGEEIKDWLRRSFEVHGRHFAWAVGRDFGNEEGRDGPEAAAGEEAYDPMRLFAGM